MVRVSFNARSRPQRNCKVLQVRLCVADAFGCTVTQVCFTVYYVPCLAHSPRTLYYDTSIVSSQVCSDTGVQYSAPCVAHCHGVSPTNYTAGDCSASTTPAGTTNSFLRACIATCSDVPTQHVCTASQEQFSTPCEAHCRGIPPSNYTLGECLTTTSSSTSSSTSTPDPDAPTTEPLNASAALVLCLTECSPVSAPVCASAGHSYFNPCHALCQGAMSFTSGNLTPGLYQRCIA